MTITVHYSHSLQSIIVHYRYITLQGRRKTNACTHSRLVIIKSHLKNKHSLSGLQRHFHPPAFSYPSNLLLDAHSLLPSILLKRSLDTSSHFLDVLQINSIPANEVVNNLGVYFDPELLMERQVNKLCQVCYFYLRRLRTVCRSLTKESLLTLVHAFITSRVDYCNGVLYESNGYLLDRLQSVLNSAARLILGVSKFVSVSAATLHRWCGARVSDWTLSSGEFILWSAESTLCLAWWSHCSEILTLKIWLQGFCCLWAPCVELSSDRN